MTNSDDFDNYPKPYKYPSLFWFKVENDQAFSMAISS